jgi:hypothetical protein
VVRKDRAYQIFGRSYGNRYFIVVVSMIVVVICLDWLVSRLDKELISAEKAQFNLRLSELQASVTLMQASSVAKDKTRVIEQYIGSNPMVFLEEGVKNYAGERSLAQPGAVPGSWVYDPELDVIAYLPKHNDQTALRSSLSLNVERAEWRDKKYPQWLRFKVVGLLSKDKHSSRLNEFAGLELRIVE